jgi:2-C-methyl-D-erythritol 4-phosphate cytidylyltransferase / 2-C-methyl-D-erythritol 2,4-cyclodiphosphate synthase
MAGSMYVSAIVAAGGRGSRFGGRALKQLVPVGGRPILERSVRVLATHPAVGEVIVAVPQDVFENPPGYLRGARIRVVAGGPRRRDSVANAFGAVAPDTDIVVVHDAARPFASADLISRAIAAAAEAGAAIAALVASDTVKVAGPAQAGPAEAGHYVRETLDRASIYLAQTPQAFRRDVLRDALAIGGDGTDEAALAERAGHRVRIVDGEVTNIKITTPDDLPLAEAIASQSSSQSAIVNPQSAILNPQSAVRTGRAGTGYDLHRLVPERPLVVGGVTIPFDRGPHGHSDGDVVCHAIVDAVLGAAGVGDIGRHFPDTDPRWAGASSLDLLARTAALVSDEGLEVGNVDVTVVLERPKIAPHIESMRANVARALGIAAGRVSIKGKTNEGVDAVGRGEAIAAHAVALVRSKR